MSYSNVDPPLLLTSSARFISEGGGPIGCSNACNAAGRFNDLRVLLTTDFRLISDTINNSFISPISLALPLVYRSQLFQFAHDINLEYTFFSVKIDACSLVNSKRNKLLK